jgi:hypothetical protein
LAVDDAGERRILPEQTDASVPHDQHQEARLAPGEPELEDGAHSVFGGYKHLPRRDQIDARSDHGLRCSTALPIARENVAAHWLLAREITQCGMIRRHANGKRGHGVHRLSMISPRAPQRGLHRSGHRLGPHRRHGRRHAR